MRSVFYILLITLTLFSCGKKSHFEAIKDGNASKVNSGDIIIVSAGSVVSTVAPFPLHKIALFSPEGEFKFYLYEGRAGEFLYGAALDPVTKDLLFSIENVDRVDKVDLESLIVTSSIIDVNLSGTTIRAVATLNDGSVVIAESPTVIEKFSASGVRATAPFPLTVPTAIQNIKAISGNRFIVTFTNTPDAPQVYNADGTLAGTFQSTSPCGTNCDPWDVVELPDGRFVVNSRITHGLYLYSATFTYIGVLYLDTTVLQMPTGMTLLSNGNLLVCNNSFNTCEEIVISGNSGTRAGKFPLIKDSATARQPQSVLVVP